MVVAGLCVAPLGLTMMFTAPVYARLSSRYGPKTTLIIGLLVIAAGYGGGLGLMSAAWQTVVTSVVLGAGIGLAYSSLPALIVGAVPASETGAANGLNTLMRSIGTSVSSAVIGMVLANTSDVVGGVAVPTLHGFRVSFGIATAAVAVGLVLALFLPGRRPSAHPQLRASSEEEANLERAREALRGFRGGCWTRPARPSPTPGSPSSTGTAAARAPRSPRPTAATPSPSRRRARTSSPPAPPATAPSPPRRPTRARATAWTWTCRCRRRRSRRNRPVGVVRDVSRTTPTGLPAGTPSPAPAGTTAAWPPWRLL